MKKIFVVLVMVFAFVGVGSEKAEAYVCKCAWEFPVCGTGLAGGYCRRQVPVDEDTVCPDALSTVSNSVCDRNGDGYGVACFDDVAACGGGGGAKAKDASCVSNTIPTTMTAGQTYSVSVTMKNTGTTTWSPVGSAENITGYYMLGTADDKWDPWGGNRRAISLPVVAPGSNGVASFSLTAPTTPGTYSAQYRMIQQNVEWFGAICGPAAVVVNAPRTGVLQGRFMTEPGRVMVSDIKTLFPTIQVWLNKASLGIVRDYASKYSSTTWVLDNLSKSKLAEVGLPASIDPGPNVLLPPPGYDVGYTKCLNDIACHSTKPITPGNTASVIDTEMTLPASNYTDLYWHFCQKAQPTSITVASSLCGTLDKSVSWAAVNGAVSYALRIDDLSTPWIGNCSDVAGNTKNGDLCEDNLTATSKLFKFVEGHKYSIWVHAINACGGGWRTPASTSYIQPTCSKTWNFTLNPICEIDGLVKSDVSTQTFVRTLVFNATDVPVDTVGPAGFGPRNVSVTSDKVGQMMYVGLRLNGAWTNLEVVNPNIAGIMTGIFEPNTLWLAKWDRSLLSEQAGQVKNYPLKFKLPPSLCPGPTSTPTSTPAPTITPNPTLPPPQCEVLRIDRKNAQGVWVENVGVNAVKYGDNTLLAGDTLNVRYVANVNGMGTGVGKVGFVVEKTLPGQPTVTTNHLVSAVCVGTSQNPIYQAIFQDIKFDAYATYRVRTSGIMSDAHSGNCAVVPTAVPTSVPTLVPTPVGCENPVQCSTTVPCCTGFTCNVSMGVCMNPIIIEQ